MSINVRSLNGIVRPRKAFKCTISALGHKRTLRQSTVMSALPSKADMCAALAHVCFGQQADIRMVRLIRCQLPTTASSSKLAESLLGSSVYCEEAERKLRFRLTLEANVMRFDNRIHASLETTNGRPLCPRCRAPLWSVRVQLEDTADDKRMFQCTALRAITFNQQPSAMLCGISNAHRSPTINNTKIKG
jgi:hypothetical protein